MRSGMQAKSWNTCADDLASRTAKGASWFDQRSDLGIVGDRESIKLPPDPRERRVWTVIGFTSLVRADN